VSQGEGGRRKKRDGGVLHPETAGEGWALGLGVNAHSQPAMGINTKHEEAAGVSSRATMISRDTEEVVIGYMVLKKKTGSR